MRPYNTYARLLPLQHMQVSYRKLMKMERAMRQLCSSRMKGVKRDLLWVHLTIWHPRFFWDWTWYVCGLMVSWCDTI